MKVATSAIIGLILGAITGFVAYCIVFIFTDVLDTASRRLDIEESHIFFFVLLFSATWGSIVGALFALIRAGKQKVKGKIETQASSTSPKVWPPAPKI